MFPGRKWFKHGEFGMTSYASGIEYHDGKLAAIYAPDGRMVAEYAGGQITRYRAEYFHQDHLGRKGYLPTHNTQGEHAI